MKELITIPLVASLILSVSIELIAVAESASDKVINYAQDMDNALDCAFRGIDITICSPNLGKESFELELEKTKEVIDKLKSINITLINETTAEIEYDPNII
jgi:hypothetical protein